MKLPPSTSRPLCVWLPEGHQGEYGRSKGRSQGPVGTLVCRVRGTQLIWLGCSCGGFQRLTLWDTELKRHSRSAPICLDDNLQPSSANGHCLQGKALPTMDAKTRPAIQDWTLIQYEWKLTRAWRKQDLYNPSCFSYCLGRGVPKAGLHTVAMGNNTFR